jgi:HlyD family secretion protein
MKKLILIVIVLLVIGAGVGAYYYKKGGPEPTVTTLQITRGDIVDQVGATGTLQAVTTVQVGTQVSGIIQDLYADFNDIVKKGQIIARLDPSLLQTSLDTAKANLVNAQANLERQRVAVEDSKTKLKRAQELFAKNLAPRTDLETAEVAEKQAEAQLKSTQSQIVQAEAAVNKAKVDLDHTVITAPIDGIITARSVDKGQTVAASMSAPTLFIIAADLTKMQVNANIDESDVGRMRPGQTVRFRVDAYPNDTFVGTVQQVRLNPTTVQNVVTYSTVIDVPNPNYRLMPGMTANLNIEIARRSNVLRVPNAATRFRPTRDTFAALNQAVTPDIERALGGGRGGFGGRGRGDAGSMTGGSNGSRSGQGRTQANGQPAANGQGGAAFNRGGGDASGGGRGGANMTPEERQKRMQERLAQMTPEQRQQFEERMRQRGARGGAEGGAQNARPANAPNPRGTATPSATASGAATIDSLFGPLPTTESRGRVWLYINKQMKPVSLRLGISDGTWTEVLDGNELQPGTEVVTNVTTGLEQPQRPGNQSPGAGNPLMGPQRGRGRG